MPTLLPPSCATPPKLKFNRHGLVQSFLSQYLELSAPVIGLLSCRRVHYYVIGAGCHFELMEREKGLQHSGTGVTAEKARKKDLNEIQK